MILDGVIKHSLHHVTAPLIEVDSSELKHWFKVCREYNLLGQDLGLIRDGAATATSVKSLIKVSSLRALVSGLDEINDEQLCWVTQVDASNNQVYSEGPIKPSSESMTHSTYTMRTLRFRPSSMYTVQNCGHEICPRRRQRVILTVPMAGSCRRITQRP